MNNDLLNITLPNWIESLQAKGRNSFSLTELRQVFSSQSQTAVKRSLARLSSKGKIVSISKGFYLIISLQYSSKGILPPNLFLDDLMKQMERRYYVGLLNAAAFFGAAHQQPQEYFVFTELPALRSTSKKGVKINYISKKKILEELLEERKTEVGYLKISSAVLTAVDLIQFERRIGGLNRAVNVLSELIGEIKVEQWNRIFLKEIPVSTIQRLGYVLDCVLQKKRHSEKLYHQCQELGLQFFRIPLKSSGITKDLAMNKRWKVIHNIEIEVDK